MLPPGFPLKFRWPRRTHDHSRGGNCVHVVQYDGPRTNPGSQPWGFGDLSVADFCKTCLAKPCFCRFRRSCVLGQKTHIFMRVFITVHFFLVAISPFHVCSCPVLFCAAVIILPVASLGLKAQDFVFFFRMSDFSRLCRFVFR